jgi:prepilin-type N-terminal cleavage/methylation domain-containing protein
VKRGFTLIELMVALVISTMVISGVLLTLQYQFKNWVKLEQKAQMTQMTRGVQSEFSRVIRMAGGEMAAGTGGIRDIGDSGVCVILNENSLSWTPLDVGDYQPGLRTFKVAMSRDTQVTPGMILSVRVNAPPKGSSFGTTRTLDTLLTMNVSAVKHSSDSTQPDSITFNANDLAADWTWSGALQAKVGMSAYSGDSICYRRRADTLMKFVQDVYRRKDSGYLAIDIDSFKVKYFVVSKGWVTAISNVGVDTIQKVHVRLVVRSHNIDPTLLRMQPSSGGYNRQATELEYSLRNWQYIVSR